MFLPEDQHMVDIFNEVGQLNCTNTTVTDIVSNANTIRIIYLLLYYIVLVIFI